MITPGFSYGIYEEDNSDVLGTPEIICASAELAAQVLKDFPKTSVYDLRKWIDSLTIYSFDDSGKIIGLTDTHPLVISFGNLKEYEFNVAVEKFLNMIIDDVHRLRDRFILFNGLDKTEINPHSCAEGICWYATRKLNDDPAFQDVILEILS